MRLTWHIVGKDMRRFWIAIPLLVGLIGVKLCLLDGVFHLEISRDMEGSMWRYQILLMDAVLIFSFFVTVAIVQEDPVSEPGAFWQNLPITRRQLLGAKLLSVTLICGLPAVLALAVGWLAFGLPANRIGWPLAVISEAQFASCLAAFAFGGLTKNVAHVVFWIIGVVLAFFISHLTIEPLLNLRSLVSPGTHFTHILLLNFLWVIGCLAIILNQYLTQLRSRSIVLLIAGMLLAFYVAETERTRFSVDFLSVLQPAQHELDEKIALLSADVVRAELVKQKPGSDATEMLRVSVQDANQGLIVSPNNYVGQWTQSGTAPLPVSAKIYRVRDRSLKRAVEQAFGFPSSTKTNSLIFGAESTIPGEDAELLGGKSAPYQGQIDLNVQRAVIDGQMGLAKGASIRSDFGEARIKDVFFDKSIIQVDVESEFAAPTHDPGWFDSIVALGAPRSHLEGALVNTKTRTVLTPARTSTGISVYAYGIFLVHAKLQFVLSQAEDQSSSLADWVIVEVRMGENHRSIKTFKEDVFLKVVPAIERDAAWTE